MCVPLGDGIQGICRRLRASARHQETTKDEDNIRRTEESFTTEDRKTTKKN
jgi:hypothetical protein